ncbi:MAG TPA: asparagine synthase-related protein [Sphingomonadaceae bacterium]|nr:asparagine synthase-related protein [Sphingomonadaceae bacterium]
MAAFRNAGARAAILARMIAAARGAHLSATLDLDALITFASGSAMPVEAGGVVLGTTIMRGACSPLAELTPAHQRSVAQSRGEWLIDACWGGYIAMLAQPERRTVEILRAPLGDLPCYVVRVEGAVLLASDVQLLLAGASMRPELSSAALARHLAPGDIRRRETCLHGVEELAGGERITITPDVIERRALWSPWRSATSPSPLPTAEDAAARVSDAAQHCVSARVNRGSHVLLKLSGGLDSSILAACLARAGQPHSCLTLVTEDPAGDERRYAREVARALQVPLIEAVRQVGTVNLRRSAAARLPRPTARSFTQESDRIAADAASEVGADLIFDGGGGDNVFCSQQSVRPLIDALRCRVGVGAVIETATSIASLAQVSIATVARRALIGRWRGTCRYAWPLDLRYLSDEARQAAAAAAAHPWLEAPPGALPGKAAHVALVMAAQSVVEGEDVQDAISTYSPLISQPLVEACLEVPSWLWFQDGLNRWIARKAFADDLPADVAFRRSKGSPDSFVADIFDANRATVRDMLLGGELARLGLLDLPRLGPALRDTGPLRSHDFLRLMQLVDAEAWARSWTSHG